MIKRKATPKNVTKIFKNYRGILL